MCFIVKICSCRLTVFYMFFTLKQQQEISQKTANVSQLESKSCPDFSNQTAATSQASVELWVMEFKSTTCRLNCLIIINKFTVLLNIITKLTESHSDTQTAALCTLCVFCRFGLNLLCVSTAEVCVCMFTCLHVRLFVLLDSC